MWMNAPPFLATGKQKQTQQGKGGKAGEGREQEGTGPAELSSFSGPATNSRTRESVWTAHLTEPVRPMLETRLSLPALRGATPPSFIPGGKGRGCSNAAKGNPQLEKQTDKLGNQEFGLFPGIKVEAGGWPVLRQGPHPFCVDLRTPYSKHVKLKGEHWPNK